jgi:hypothetical protein
LEAYRGGNTILWQLHQLDIRDKHKLLIPIGAVHTATMIEAELLRLAPGETEARRVPVQKFERRAILADGDVVPDPVSEHYNPRPIFDLAFHEPGIIERTLVMPTLQAFVGETERVVNLFQHGFFA